MMKGWVGLAGLLALAALAVMVLSPADSPEPLVTAAVSDPPPDTDHIAFLAAPGFDPTAPGSAIVLHPLATGNAYLLIEDSAALSRAQRRGVYFTDDPQAEFRRTMLSILFLSPPGMGTRSGFVSLFGAQKELETFTCYRIHCAADGHDRDIGQLINAGKPVALLTEEVTGLASYNATLAMLLATPGHYLHTPAQPASIANNWPGYVTLRLPGRYHLLDQSHHLGWPEDDTEAKVTALLTELGIEGELQHSHGNQSGYGLSMFHKETGALIEDDNGYPLHFDRLVTSAPSVRIWTTEDGAAKLTQARERLAALGNPTPPSDAALREALRRFLDDHGLNLPPDLLDLKLDDTVLVPQQASVSQMQEERYYISYFAPVAP